MKPVLYVIVRGDLASLNPGKAAAQVAHAANQLVSAIERLAATGDNEFLYLLRTWQGTHGFGTTIVLQQDQMSMFEIEGYLMAARDLAGAVTGVVTDPTYPLRDGHFTHYVPVETCAFVFGDKDKLYPVMHKLPLMK